MLSQPFTNSLWNNPRSLLRRRFHSWLDRRVPPQRTLLLTRKNIFIFPSKAGFAFIALIGLFWLVATNYENNLLMALTFLLVGLLIVSKLHTFFNLSGIRITAVRSNPAFVGEDAEVNLILEREGQRPHENLFFNYPEVPPRSVTLSEGVSTPLTLFYKPKRRGWVRPRRMLVQTWYPLGLLRAWTWLDLDTATLVYPKPIPAGPLPVASSYGEAGLASSQLAGGEDFHSLKDYQAGDSLRHVAWKAYAQGRGMHTKEFSATVDHRIWIDWDYLGGQDRETRLSRLCYWVLQAEQGSDDYGLRLPGVEIPPNRGASHRDALLRELALFEHETHLSNTAQ